MTATWFWRGGMALVDDAIDRIRGDFPAFALLHVLPSLPFFAATLYWFVEVDLRGAMPSGEDAWIALLVLPKIAGWGALSAWSGAAARGNACGVGRAWRIALARLPEVALTGGLYVVSVMLGLVSVIGFVGVPVSLTAMAATVSDARAGGFAALRRSADVASIDLGRSCAVLGVAFLAWLFVALNLLILPLLLMALGAGGLGIDLSLVQGAFGLDRAATSAFAGLVATTLLEGVIVVAFAELQRDREAEREGTRFELFAAELEQRAATAVRAVRERVS